MKKTALCILTLLLTMISLGQARKHLILSFSTGKLTSPYYEDAKARGNYAFSSNKKEKPNPARIVNKANHDPETIASLRFSHF